MDKQKIDEVKIEEIRRKEFRLFVLFIVLSSLSGASGFGLIVFGGITDYLQWLFVSLGFVIFFIPTTIFVFLAMRAHKTFFKCYYESFAPYLVKDIYGEYHFIYDFDPEDIYKEAPFKFVKKADPDESTYTSGMDNGMKFRSFSYHYMGMRNGHPDDFGGKYIELTIPKEYEGEALIEHRRSLDFFKNPPYMKERINAESSKFEHDYAVLTNESLKGIIILSPILIDGLNRLNDSYKAKISLYIKGNKIYAFVDDYHYFKLAFNKPINDQDTLLLKNEEELPSLLYRITKECLW